MGIKEGALALADELEAFEDGDCEECIAYGQPECKGHLSCAEIIARYSARKVREAVERDAEDVTTVSAYDLLPDEDRKAIAWVREHGGLDEVRKLARYETKEEVELVALNKLRHLAGVRQGEAASISKMGESLARRLMPEGMEWPRYEDGEPVRVRDKIEDIEVRSIVFNEGGILLSDCTSVPGWGTWRSYKERVKRPAVLAADGESLEVGQTVYGTRDLEPVEIVSLRSKEYDGVRTVKCKDRTGFVFYAPDDLIHQRPVLDADGVPIREGDTVYVLGFGEPLTVKDFTDDGRVLMSFHDENSLGYKPSKLTHERPESWERLEEDAGKNPFDYCKDVGHRLDTCENAERFKARDIVRRAKALAERERSE